jgi:hypothetical protein
VCSANGSFFVEIGHRSRQLQNSLASARRESETLHREFENSAAFFVRSAHAIHVRVGEASVAHALAGELNIPRPGDSGRRGGTTLAAIRRLTELIYVNARHLYMHVHAIEQGSRNPGTVTLHLRQSAVAIAGGISIATARTRIHGCNELKRRRILVL